MNPTLELPTTIPVYEFPLNERFRTFLRLEALYHRWLNFVASSEQEAHHSAVQTLFEINEFAQRYDIKGELFNELERYKKALAKFSETPGISQERMTQTQLRIVDAQHQLTLSPKFGSTLAENEWLSHVKTRLVSPGCVCSFDIGFYYQWLHGPIAQRREELHVWMTPLMPMFEGMELLLMMVRDFVRHKFCRTEQQSYQQAMQGHSFDLLQITEMSSATLIPEINGNKHIVWIRFLPPPARTTLVKAASTGEEVEFNLGLCGI